MILSSVINFGEQILDEFSGSTDLSNFISKNPILSKERPYADFGKEAQRKRQHHQVKIFANFDEKAVSQRFFIMFQKN